MLEKKNVKIQLLLCFFSSVLFAQNKTGEFGYFTMKVPKKCSIVKEDSMSGKLIFKTDTIVFVYGKNAFTQADIFISSKVQSYSDTTYAVSKAMKELYKTRDISVDTIKTIVTIIDKGPKQNLKSIESYPLEILYFDLKSGQRVAFLSASKPISKSTGNALISILRSITFKN